MEQDKQQEEFVNCKTDKKTENSTKREPNPKPMHKIFDGVKPQNKKKKPTKRKY